MNSGRNVNVASGTFTNSGQFTNQNQNQKIQSNLNKVGLNANVKNNVNANINRNQSGLNGNQTVLNANINRNQSGLNGNQSVLNSNVNQSGLNSHNKGSSNGPQIPIDLPPPPSNGTIVKKYDPSEKYSKNDIVEFIPSEHKTPFTGGNGTDSNASEYIYFRSLVDNNKSRIVYTPSGAIADCKYWLRLYSRGITEFSSPSDSGIDAKCVKVASEWTDNRFPDDNTIQYDYLRGEYVIYEDEYYIANVDNTGKKPLQKEKEIYTNLENNIIWTKLKKITIDAVAPDEKQDQKFQRKFFGTVFIPHYEPQKSYLKYQLVAKGSKVYVAIDSVPPVSKDDPDALRIFSPGESNDSFLSWTEFRTHDITTFERVVRENSKVILFFGVLLAAWKMGDYLFEGNLKPEMVRLAGIKRLRIAFKDLFLRSKLYTQIHSIVGLGRRVQEEALRFPTKVSF